MSLPSRTTQPPSIGSGDRAAAVFTEHEVRRPRRIRLPAGPVGRWPRELLAELDWGRWPAYHRSTWSRYDLIQVFTTRDAEAVRALAPGLGDRVRVNPFGLDVPAVLPPAPSTSREIVFVGNFTHPPNVDAALWLASEIMPRLRASGAQASLRVVGPWAPPAVRALGCQDVHVTGAVDDLRPVLQAAAVVLAPLRTGGGMRMKVLEGMALGKAVVTTPRGAEGLGGDGELPLAVAETADEIATLTARLLADPRLRSDLGERARAFVVEHHSARAYAARLEQVYTEARGLRALRTQ